jgi:hypothetical protein
MAIGRQADHADWDFWGNVPLATLREAVALSLGRDPRRPLVWANADPQAATFRTRVEMAERCYGRTLPSARYDPYGSSCQRVDLRKFRQWAESLDPPWGLPESFPGRRGHIQSAAQPPAPPLTAQKHVTHPQQPLGRQAAQEQAILAKLGELGFDPRALPKRTAGKAGAKAEVRKALGTSAMWAKTSVFKKAWERLRKRAEIRGD